MKAIGLLMREHRSIEHMMALMEEEKRRIDRSQEADLTFIDAVVDYFETYVDKTHHVKEEEIQFKTLAGKNMAPELNRIMQELIDEHASARDIIANLDISLREARSGDGEANNRISENLGRMVELYPMHIEKEDKHFFFPSLNYLSEEEQKVMLDAFREYDRGMIHEKYNRVVEEMKERLAKSPALSQNRQG